MQPNRLQKHLSQNSSQFKSKKTTADNGNQSKQKNHSRKSKDDPGQMDTSWNQWTRLKGFLILQNYVFSLLKNKEQTSLTTDLKNRWIKTKIL